MHLDTYLHVSRCMFLIKQRVTFLILKLQDHFTGWSHWCVSPLQELPPMGHLQELLRGLIESLLQGRYLDWPWNTARWGWRFTGCWLAMWNPGGELPAPRVRCIHRHVHKLLLVYLRPHYCFLCYDFCFWWLAWTTSHLKVWHMYAVIKTRWHRWGGPATQWSHKQARGTHPVKFLPPVFTSGHAPNVSIC